MVRVVLLAVVVLAACARRAAPPSTGAGGVPAAQTATYYVYVANESSDLVSRLAFTPATGIRLVDNVTVGLMPADIDGPHGITTSKDGTFWYVTLAHGTPFGKAWKFAAGADTLAGQVELGMFPATMSLTPDGQFLFVVNFNLHGDPVPSSVSVVYTPTMTEVARPTTCVMPHGSRVNAAGTKHYSACMHSEQIVELDTRTFQVTARFSVVPGQERPLPRAERGEHGQHGAAGAAICSPTWAQPGRGAWAPFVYVPCNRNQEILEVDTRTWQVTRRFATGKGPYNLEVTPDGRLLLATLKGAQGVAVFDLSTGREAARIGTTQPITHGAVVSPDGRYAFITNEAIGSTRGTVDVIDLARLERVASTPVQYQPGGIDFWTMTQ